MGGKDGLGGAKRCSFGHSLADRHHDKRGVGGKALPSRAKDFSASG
jgi:hypothetical protein